MLTLCKCIADSILQPQKWNKRSRMIYRPQRRSEKEFPTIYLILLIHEKKLQFVSLTRWRRIKYPFILFRFFINTFLS